MRMHSMTCSADARAAIKVFEATLRKDDGSDLSRMTIKFALAAQLRGDVNAEDRQATVALISATEAVNPLSSTPAAVWVLGSVVDTSTNVTPAVQTLETTWSILLQRIELFDKFVTGIAQIHPYTSLAWSVISAANQVLVNQKNRDDQIMRLAGTMSDVFAFVHDAEPLKAIKAHIKTITLLIQQVTECGYFITEYAKQKNFWIRTAKYTISDIDSRITDYENKLQELKTAFLEGVAVQTGITVVRMMNVVNHIDAAESIDLNDMPYAFGARYAQEKGCLPGTRESFLSDICGVLNNPDEDAPRVCLLIGVAGSGKSAVAHSIARLYDGQKRLGSSYFFASTDAARRNPQNLFSTIARDLSDHDPQFKAALWGVVKEDRALRTSQSPFEQVERFIVEPRKDLDAIGPLVIVIDALDESGDRVSRRQVLRAIADKIANDSLPNNLRFLLTARPEDDILTALPPGPHIVRKQMGDIPEHIIDGDIEKFIRHSLDQYTELDISWPNQEWCRLLVHHSQHLFQWASTACSFIDGDGTVGLDPSERLDQLLQAAKTDGGHSLDHLYKTILSQLFTLDNTRERFRTVMAIVLALKEPLPLASLSALLSKDLNIRAIIKPLGSLLDGVLGEEKPIRPLHTSFRDFLLDNTRSSAIFHVPIQPQHSLCLGQALVVCMQNMLKFNICDLKDSRVLNTDIPDLPAQVNNTIPPHLSYACQYWMYHLQDAECTPDLLNEVTLFFKAFLPYWLEAISLLSLSSPLPSILSALETCSILKKWAKGQEIATLASEAFQFIQVFSPVLRESTPHLYLSAMPQTPSSSSLCELWLHHLQKHVSVAPGDPTNWPADIQTLQGHTDYVTCAVYSPDGTHIASGSWDNTIRVWNVTTGQFVAGPFQGHTDIIASIAYSPDGIHIVSGSWDNTLRVWNVATGQCVAGPIHGHTDVVSSVAYSPNGVHTVSSSWDNTLMVWDATTGQLVEGPFQGHTNLVSSVACAPDGIHIVSGSEDKTIRIWNVLTRQCVAGPFQGHADIVTSVAYSPDGTCVVSGSADKTIMVWNATTGQLVVGPFQGHTNSVSSVACSPDGIHIVSGSLDNTIIIWNATTGQSVAGPFHGHTDSVTSVAYSPEGSYVVSAAGDKTIRIWNVTTSQPVADPFQGHTNVVSSVAYSHNGVHIVSGSWDNTLMVWNATTGQCVVGPFHGHTDGVYSVAYSPDGTHIVSGSEDKTIRIWNALTGQCVAGPFQGHTDIVTSVAYSPDGTCIVSGSMDQTIRVWNVLTG
ncbi:WD40 repeat-like protein, partial [Imleria badia]